ncbi:MAG: adenosylcobinamide-GDP ribazoletransferase [Deltaproteobacteria bacterium]|nr:adenosylcobinamide-GDP ribazoletransferase [Candidatus Anaeroferrophillacea bacterium]
MLHRLHLALSFLTRLPLPQPRVTDAGEIGASQAMFPLAGLCLGLLAAALHLFVTRHLPRPVEAAGLLVLFTWMTGGFHLDGLADTADGIFSGRNDPDDILAIMKDSAIGTMGTLALLLVLLLKFSCLTSLPADLLLPALLLYPTAGRLGIVIQAKMAPYARPRGGLGKTMVDGADGRRLAGAAAATFAVAAATAGFSGIAVTATGMVYVYLITRYFIRRLGGATGDTFGFTVETAETVILLCFSLIAA